MERIQHLNTEFRMEVKKERYRLNLSLSSRLRATNQNLYEVFQIRPVKQTLLLGIKKRGWCYIVEDTCKAGAFRIHLVQYVSKSQTDKCKFIQTHWNSKSDASHQCSPAWISEPMQSLLGCLGRGYRSRSYNCFDIILLSHRVHNNVPTY